MTKPKIASPPDSMTVEEQVQAAIDFELEQRRWLRVLLPYCFDNLPPLVSPAAEFGRNLVRLAACQRVCRILRADLPTANRQAEASMETRPR